MPKLIDTIKLPEGLRTLSVTELETVVQELREELIRTLSGHSGHFASSLGAAEISVALHSVFSTPHDRIVWDVGHQCYIHKMLTGRREEIRNIRNRDGISGFLRREESAYDCFGAGHAGTSVSAALGMAVALSAAALTNENPERRAVAVLGDGSLTCGMALEALNHAGHLGSKLIVVLNDNDMSISPNVGALSSLFSKTVTSHYSTLARSGFKKLYRSGYVPELVYRAIDKAEEAAQGFLATPAMLFSAFGFRYIGPIDGHNMTEILSALKRAIEQDVPVLIHCRTIKGKGFLPAEEDPVTWHAVRPFDPESGEFLPPAQSTSKKLPTFTDVYAQSLIKLAEQDKSIVAVTAAMATGTGLDKFEKVFPERFYDVAICEQHAVTFCAGLACEGLRPFCTIYSTFLQRGYDQVVHDVCLQNLPVVFAMDRGGVVGNDGHTHQGVFDIAFLRCLPNLVIMSPKDENEFQHMLFTASKHDGPVAIRYPRGNAFDVPLDEDLKIIPIGKSEVLRTGTDVLLLAFGPLVKDAVSVAELLEKDLGISVGVINARFTKPLDQELLASELPKYSYVCTLEDHALQGGFGSAVLELVNDQAIALKAPIERFGVKDLYIAHGSQDEQRVMNGFDKGALFSLIAARFRRPAKVVNQ